MTPGRSVRCTLRLAKPPGQRLAELLYCHNLHSIEEPGNLRSENYTTRTSPRINRVPRCVLRLMGESRRALAGVPGYRADVKWQRMQPSYFRFWFYATIQLLESPF